MSDLFNYGDSGRSKEAMIVQQTLLCHYELLSSCEARCRQRLLPTRLS